MGMREKRQASGQQIGLKKILEKTLHTVYNKANNLIMREKEESYDETDRILQEM